MTTIDIIFAVVALLAVIKGYQRGLIVGVFSLVAIIVGLAVAMKFSSIAASFLADQFHLKGPWLPLVSFLILLIGVVLLIRLGANALEETVKAIMLGWLNKLAGIALYLFIFSMVFSVVLFYAEKYNLIEAQTLASSIVYPYLKPIAPTVIDGFAKLIPFFKDLFVKLA
jgi:membrane protein required for colicin V production